MFLMIRNAGVVDPRALTLLGVSGTRYESNDDTIGQFGSGSKHAIAVFLRHSMPVTYISGNLKMNFFTKPVYVSGRQYNQICVKYAGKDAYGANRSSTEEMGAATEWGVRDWTEPLMGFREFVSNAIDGAVLAGGSYKDVEFEVVDAPRAKAGHTAVFLPLNKEVQELWDSLGTMFLHFSRPHLLKEKCLPKLDPNSDNVFFYKKGVLACTETGKSVFDYNLGDELTLDESRNASSWDVRYAVAKALSNAEPNKVAQVLLAQLSDKEIWESKLDATYLYSQYDSKDTIERKAVTFNKAFKIIAGDTGVITKGIKQITDVIERKGFKPIKVASSWFDALEKYGIANEAQVLQGLEKEGLQESEATPDMLVALDKIWQLIIDCDMVNGREKPPVKAFCPIMSAEAQTLGQYKNSTVYIHTDLATMSPMLLKVMLEEVAHHCTGSGDLSRDLQDYLFRMIIKMWF